MGIKQGSAFITTRKGFCYLTVKYRRQNFHVMRIRNYTIDAVDKRDMRRLYPDVLFDWKKITQQLTEKREVCRCYRSRRRTPATARGPGAREPFYGVFEPSTGIVYVNGVPSTIGGVGALLDAVLRIDRTLKDAPSPPPLEARCEAEPVKRSGSTKPRKRPV